MFSKLSTVWRQLYGHNHGIVVASDFYESVSLHRLQQRELVPGEKDVAVEIKFTPEPAQEMYLACLWRYVEAADEDPSFYTFAIITRDPPPEVQAAGHDRCVIPIRPESLDSWLDPDPGNLSAVNAILDHPIDAYYQHKLPGALRQRSSDGAGSTVDRGHHFIVGRWKKWRKWARTVTHIHILSGLLGALRECP